MAFRGFGMGRTATRHAEVANAANDPMDIRGQDPEGLQARIGETQPGVVKYTPGSLAG